MHRAVTHLPMALLFLASVVPSNGQMRRSEKETAGETSVTVTRGAPLTVECSLQPQQKLEWRLDGGDKPLDMRPEVTTSAEVVVAKLTAPAASAKHAGVYTCAKSSPRIRVTVTDTVSSSPVVTSPAAAPQEPFEGELTYFEVRSQFKLNCSGLEGTGDITWTKNGTSFKPDLQSHIELSPENGVNGAILAVPNGKRSTENDYGNYTCSNGVSKRSFMLKSRLHAKLQSDTNAVEGQKLKITCKVIGLPCQRVTWVFTNETFNATNVEEVFGDRVMLKTGEQGINDTELIFNKTERSDAGFFNCTPVTDDPTQVVSARTQLRVKDMYAALWPFLGICAEVFVLCAVILVYEKRRTKPELDDSDTDNHDQKKS